MVRAKMSPMGVTVVVLGLLAMVQPSLQVSFENPFALFPRTIPNQQGLAFGLVTKSKRAEQALIQSPEFVGGVPIVRNGRTFLTGSIYGAPVVLVRSSGKPSANVAITVQLLVQNFDLAGVVHFGSCGAIDKSLKVGTVVIPGGMAFSGNIEWLSMDANEQGQLRFAEYNSPQNGDNLMGSLKYNEIDIYYKGKIIRSSWIYPKDSLWLRAASRVQIDSGDVVYGLNASSSDVRVRNTHYGEFLSKLYGAAVVDTTSVAAGLGAKSNDLKYISIQGVSNHLEDRSPGSASKNVAKAVINFIWQATVPRSAADV